MKETIEILRQIIIDFGKRDLPLPIMRDLHLPKLPKHVQKVRVLVGMRRSGKTWSMYQIMQELLASGVPRENILYVNFEDERLSHLKAEDLQSILDMFFEEYPHLINQKIHLFFDEIHEVDGWEKFIRRLVENEEYDIYITGSSAKMLSKEIATSLRGRTLSQEIFPFNFIEYLRFHNIKISSKPSSKEKSVLRRYSKLFLTEGGFPESLGALEDLHCELLQGYIQTVIYRDVVERHKVSNVAVLKELIQYCIQNSSSLISINRLYNRLKSSGWTVSKGSLYEFMDYLEDAYCLFTVPIFTFSQSKRSVTPKKVYCVDQGLIRAFSIKRDFDEAAKLENLVFCHLRNSHPEIFYYSTKSGKEVDFIIEDHSGEKVLIQVCVALTETSYPREVDALKEAMTELGLKKSTIVTVEEGFAIEDDYKDRIQVQPLWKFLLHL